LWRLIRYEYVEHRICYHMKFPVLDGAEGASVLVKCTTELHFTGIGVVTVMTF
jgi:hypothetical protein